MVQRSRPARPRSLAAWLHRLRYSPRVNQLRYRFYLTVLAFPRLRRCNLCGWRGATFLSYLHKRVLCPRCGSQIRHRLIGAALSDRPDLTAGVRLTGARVLHCTPEFCLESRWRPHASRYVTTAWGGDRSHPDVQADLTRLPFRDASFDVAVACDVLEHIPDDRVAMAEVRRVLARNGVAIITVPTFDGNEPTFEDPSIVDPDARTAAFGQSDHVRNYGVDIVGRLEQAGFAVSMVEASDFDPALVRRSVLLPPVPLASPLGWNQRRVFFARRV